MNVVVARAPALLIVLIIGIAHVLCGLIIVLEPAAAWVTPFHSMAQLLAKLYTDGSHHFIVGAALIITGLAAVVASQAPLSASNKVLLAYPQQLVLTGQFAAIVTAASLGVYPDGYTPKGGTLFILSDQMQTLLFSVYHTVWIVWLAAGGKQKE